MKTKYTILVVDDEPMIRWALKEGLSRWGYETVEAGTINSALVKFDAESPELVLLDINLPDGSGLDALLQMKKRQPEAVVIMITSDVVVENTLAALRGGAYDFIGKPIKLEELQVTIRNAFETHTLRKEVTGYRQERARQFNFEQVIGNSAALREVIELARKVAASEASSVLLQGESGTGKDLVAKAIHYGSQRADSPFVAINCAAIPATLLESELFGYEKGAFTDAKARKEGMFEQAQGGTLFLDEIGELELSLQAKLLRILEEGTFRRVGGLKIIPLDVRLITATNKDLKREGEAGRFRLDLYYRFSVIQIDMPPLRNRGDDVILLANYYIEQFNKKFGKHVRGLTPEVVELFHKYRWPGNVRELRNVIERVMILEDIELITPKYLPRGFNAVGSSPQESWRDMQPKAAIQPPESTSGGPQPSEPERMEAPRISTETATPVESVQPSLFQLPADGIILEEVEMALVQQALERSKGNQTRAAELLGISRDQLRYRLKKIEEASPKDD